LTELSFFNRGEFSFQTDNIKCEKQQQHSRGLIGTGIIYSEVHDAERSGQPPPEN